MIIGWIELELQTRMKVIRVDFKRHYSGKKGDALRQRRFEEQAGLCALGNKSIPSADSFFAKLDHRVLRTPEYQATAGRKGGRIGGHRAHELHPEMAARNGREGKSRHIRWHVRRGTKKLGCKFCSNVLIGVTNEQSKAADIA